MSNYNTFVKHTKQIMEQYKFSKSPVVTMMIITTFIIGIIVLIAACLPSAFNDYDRRDYLNLNHTSPPTFQDEKNRQMTTTTTTTATCIELTLLNELSCDGHWSPTLPPWSTPLNSNTTKLNYNDNSFTQLSNNIFTTQIWDQMGLARIQSLDLSQNILRDIQPEAFHGLISLQVLNLAYNSFRTLPNFSVMGLNELKTLNLHGNKLRILPAPATPSSSVFQNLFKLERLDLSWCDLRFVASTSFEGLTNLVSLDLSNNKLKLFEANNGLIALLPALNLLNNTNVVY